MGLASEAGQKLIKISKEERIPPTGCGGGVVEGYMEVGAYGGIWVMVNGLSGCIEMHVKEVGGNNLWRIK